VTQHIYDDAMRNTKFFPILPDGGGESDIPTFLKPWWNSHRFPSRNAGIHHMIVLAFCGFRVRRGVVLVSSRKLSRFRAGLARTEAAHEAGAATSAEAQRAIDSLLATLAGAQTLGFRQRLCSERGDDSAQGGYHADPGCGSN
jgi:hypothetical protein